MYILETWGEEVLKMMKPKVGATALKFLRKFSMHSAKWCRWSNILVLTLSVLISGAGVQTEHAITTSSDRAYVVPGGNIIGIKVNAGGAMVVDVARRWSQIRIGDVITSVNGTEVRTAGEFVEEARVSSNDNERTQISLQRNGREIQTEISADEGLTGIEVRDGQSGVGTLTYYNSETGRFGALGHGVTDYDIGIIVPMGSGVIAHCTVTGIRRSEPNMPGEFRGAFSVNVGAFGEIDRNEPTGIYGEMDAIIVNHEAVPVARTSEVKEGSALIISTIQGNTPEKYEVVIQQVNARARDNRQIVIEVTDKELIEKTGGIVQGMSGSPILQDGMFVGAVTHVILNEPTKGYGILAETMME
jgi:stage IV sporulation protein B